MEEFKVIIIRPSRSSHGRRSNSLNPRLMSGSADIRERASSSVLVCRIVNPSPTRTPQALCQIIPSCISCCITAGCYIKKRREEWHENSYPHNLRFAFLRVKGRGEIWETRIHPHERYQSQASVGSFSSLAWRFAWEPVPNTTGHQDPRRQEIPPSHPATNVRAVYP